MTIAQMQRLTHDMATIQPSFSSSKWNMGEIFGFKFHLSYLHTSIYPTKFYFFKSLDVQRSSFLLLYFRVSRTWKILEFQNLH